MIIYVLVEQKVNQLMLNKYANLFHPKMIFIKLLL